MPTVVLLRHGLTRLTGPVLAGWTPGVGLDARGRAQAAAVAERLRTVPLVRLLSSPLERCLETLDPVAASHPELEIETDVRWAECRYGDWTGRPLPELAKDPLWEVVQQRPSAMVFPGPDGESLAEVQSRAVAAVRETDAAVNETHGPDAVWLACSHGDVLKAVLADALGLHLDQFQRIVVDPCSISVVRYTPTRAYVERLNDTGTLVTARLGGGEVGGGAGAPSAR